MKYNGNEIPARPLQLPPIDRTRNTEAEFKIDIMSVTPELVGSLKTTCLLIPQIELEQKYIAVLMGLMVRIYKIYDSFVFLMNHNRHEIALLIGRSGGETAIDLTYLCSKMEKSDFDSFIKSSLSTGKKIYDEIEKDKKNNTHNNIHDIMQSGIVKEFNKVGYKIEDIDWSDRNCYGTIFDRAKKCGMERIYNYIFRNLSRMTHGNLSEFLEYHLILKDGLFYPNPNFALPQAASIEGFSILVTHAAFQYAKVMAPGSEIIGRLIKIYDWFRKMAELHETFFITNSTD
ncbi:MAG: DUF5677 domain-containing protein [Candidatus Zixiibacteriota bacterium]